MNEFTRKAMQLAEIYARACTLDERVTFECMGMTAEEAAEKAMNEARSALLAHLEGAEHEPWQVLVPREPTQLMCQAAQEKLRDWPRFPFRVVPMWQAMLEAYEFQQKDDHDR